MPESATATSVRSPVPAIRLERVSHVYGSFVALRDVSLSMPEGSSIVLLGPNGAGKSTLLKLLAGLARPGYGQVRIFGRDPVEIRGRVAYMAHQTMLYDELTGPENLFYFLGLQRPEMPDAELAGSVTEALREVDLDPRNTRRVGEYSQGMRQRASLARVLLAQPDLLLLDEPFSNLDVASAEAMVKRLRSYLAVPGTGGMARTLLLTTHQAQLAKPLADRSLQLEDGRLRERAAEAFPPDHAGAHTNS